MSMMNTTKTQDKTMSMMDSTETQDKTMSMMNSTKLQDRKNEHDGLHKNIRRSEAHD
jgi:hypothetical protein